MSASTNKIKKIPERTCIGCGKTGAKSDFIRIVRTPDSLVLLDFIGKKSGRGAYICHDPSCLKKARKTKRLERNLGVEIPDEIYEALEAELAK